MNSWIFCIAFFFVSIYFLLIGKKLDILINLLRNLQADLYIRNDYDLGLLGKEEYRKYLININDAYLNKYEIKKKEGE